MLSFLLAHLWLKKEHFQLSLKETNTEAGLLGTCSLWRTDEPKYSSHEFSLFELGEPSPGNVSTSNTLATLFPYLCSVKAWAHDWAILAFHSIMHWHGISGASGRHDFCGTKVGLFLAFPLSFMHELFPLTPLPKLKVDSSSHSHPVWAVPAPQLCHRKLCDQDTGMCQVCVTTVHHCSSSLWPPIT